MSDNLLRNLAAVMGTLVGVILYFVGYFSGQHGWWWTVFLLVVIFTFIRKIINVGH